MTESKGVIIVTGASSGIGLATCQKLLQQGYQVLGLSRNISGSLIEHKQFAAHTIDLSVPERLEQQFAEVLGEISGPIRGLVNNAGLGKMGHLEQLSVADMQLTLNTNFLGHAILTKKIISRLKSQSSVSDVVFVGSEAALRGAQQGSLYCASKFALRGFAQALREECTSSTVRVSLVNPGAVRTPFFEALDFEPGTEAENAIEPGDVADAIVQILQMRPGTVVDEINLSPQKRVWQRKKAGR